MQNNLLLIVRYLSRGAFGKCPNCSDKKIFLSRFRMKNVCGSCGIKLIDKNGDNWFFLLLIDRGLFIFPIIVAFYFQMSPERIIQLSLLLLALFIYLTPFRLGICLAFDFYFRSKLYEKN